MTLYTLSNGTQGEITVQDFSRAQYVPVLVVRNESAVVVATAEPSYNPETVAKIKAARQRPDGSSPCCQARNFWTG